MLTGRGIEDNEKEGQTWMAVFLGIEDDYYAWWVTNHYPTKIIPFHFCRRQTHRCTVATLYREPIHVDVFRILPADSFNQLAWMSESKKEQAKKILDERLVSPPGVKASAPRSAGGGTPGPGSADGGEVEEGPEGIAGLAQALGTRGRGPDNMDEKKDGEKSKKKRQAVSQAVEESSDEGQGGLRDVLNKRKAPEPVGSALKMKSTDKKKKNKSSSLLCTLIIVQAHLKDLTFIQSQPMIFACFSSCPSPRLRLGHQTHPLPLSPVRTREEFGSQPDFLT